MRPWSKLWLAVEWRSDKVCMTSWSRGCWPDVRTLRKVYTSIFFKVREPRRRPSINRKCRPLLSSSVWRRSGGRVWCRAIGPTRRTSIDRSGALPIHLLAGHPPAAVEKQFSSANRSRWRLTGRGPHNDVDWTGRRVPHWRRRWQLLTQNSLRSVACCRRQNIWLWNYRQSTDNMNDLMTAAYGKSLSESDPWSDGMKEYK